MDATATTARPGARSRDAILQAAFELCGEVGYARLTIEAVAKRAAVGKQTIYRWWGSKGALVLDALNDRTGSTRPRDFPDTGDVVADLTEQMKGMAELIVSPQFEPVWTGVIAASQTDPELAEAMVETVIEPRIQACRARLERAVEAGEIRSDVDLGTAIELLYGPLWERLLLRLGRPDEKQVSEVLDLAFAGLRPR